MTYNRNETVLVGMSGGVDSSVSALLLREQGYHVIGATMKLWDGVSYPVKGSGAACFGPHEPQRIAETQALLAEMKMPMVSIDLSQEYKAHVLDYFVRTYSSGLTPNPCIVCNRRIKFDLLLEKARAAGLAFDLFATGHYARIEYEPATNRFLLKQGLDKTRDQAYFLYALSQDQLRQTLLPLGNLTKKRVRDIARQFALSNADKSESQDFLSCDDYPYFFAGSTRPGPVYDTTGLLRGEHRGLQYYTIGQRKGLRLATGKPMYVIIIDPGRNALVIGPKEDTLSDRCLVGKTNWIACECLTGPIEAMVRIRYKHKPALARLTPVTDDVVRVNFDCPQSAITPGQSAVFYQDDIVLGGGQILE